MKTETLDTLANVSSKVTTAGATTSVIGTFLVNNIVGIAGLVIALLGYLTSAHYKRKADKRREQEFQIDSRLKENADRRFEEWQKFRMEMARKGQNVPPITDFGALAPAAGPWVDGSRTRSRDGEEEDDGR